MEYTIGLGPYLVAGVVVIGLVYLAVKGELFKGW